MNSIKIRAGARLAFNVERASDDGVEIFVNNFADNEGYDPHPNGHCVMDYRVVQ